MKRIKTWVCVALVALPMLALAEPKTADDWYKEGENQYNLGDFDQAADAFKKGFELETVEAKKPAYLYNVAQAYRQGNKCRDAVFFYKRFLALKDTDTIKPLKPEKRTEIEQLITGLEDCVKKQDDMKSRPPDTTAKPEGDDHKDDTNANNGTKPDGTKRVAAAGDGSGDDNGEDGGIRKGTTVGGPPKLLSARVLGGISKVGLGGPTVPLQATATVIAGYPITINDKLRLDVGAAFTFTPVPYDNAVSGGKDNASFVEALADVAGTYTVAPKIGIRADLGVGVLLFNGINAGNPFTMDEAGTTGALAMFAVRAGLSADYEITSNLIVTVAPIAFSYSPAKAGLSSDISSITRFDLMLGLGYRM